MEVQEKDFVISPDSVEKIFCSMMDSAERVDMEQEDFEVMITLSQKQEVPVESVAKKDKFNYYQMVENSIRYRFSFYVCDARVIIMIAMMGKTFGGIIMYLTYIQYRLKKENKRTISFKELGDMFARGFISEKALSDIWEAQKVRLDGRTVNLLDCQSAMESIQFLNKMQNG